MGEAEDVVPVVDDVDVLEMGMHMVKIRGKSFRGITFERFQHSEP